MSALIPFTYEDQPVRVITIDGEPWLVGTDVARCLGYANPTDALGRVHPDDKQTATLALSEGSRTVARDRTLVNESGMYLLVLGSTLASARAFQRWVTHEVLPSIRKTGSYGTTPALTDDELVHRALTITAAKVEKLTARLALVEPKATAFDLWLSSNVDYSVGHVANALAAVGVPDMGRTRLFRWLNEHRWAYKADGQWTPYQTAMETKRLSVKLGSQLNTRTGEQFRTVTLRITAKGAADLAVKLGVMPEAVAEALAATIEESAA